MVLGLLPTDSYRPGSMVKESEFNVLAPPAGSPARTGVNWLNVFVELANNASC